MKKISVLFFALAVIIIAILGFSSCYSHVHMPSEWIEDRAATCEADGARHKECTDCGEIIESDIIRKSEHDTVIDPRIEPTLTATGLTEGAHCSVCNAVIVEQTVIPMKQPEVVTLTSTTLEVKGTSISGKKSPATEKFSFADDITVSGGVVWTVSTDAYGVNTVATKTVPLSPGDNIFYIHVINHDQSVTTYTVSIYRNRMYTVIFNTPDGTRVEPQRVEEGYFAIEPTAPMIDQYAFMGWDYNFSLPIMGDTVINARYEYNPEMSRFEFVSKGDGYEITGIRDRSVTEVVIPDKVTSIGENAFSGCYNLRSVTVGNGVTVIGYAAFAYCAELKSVSFGNSLKTIGKEAFSGCGLTDIIIPDNVTGIGEYAFYRCMGVTKITIGQGVTSIGSYAFASCDNLTGVTVPSNVKSLGTDVFRSCKSLVGVNLNANPGVRMFADCHALENVTIGQTVTKIGNNAFQNCQGLTRITIPGNVTSIGNGAFMDCMALLDVTVSEGVKSIGNNAFEFCVVLQNITIPQSVTSIGYRAFESCDSLMSVSFKETKGWVVSKSSSGTNGTSLSSAEVADSTTATEYLHDTYKDYYWKLNK